MSFLKITDPSKREAMIKDYLETRKRIKRNLITEKTGELELQTDLSKFYRPITETQKATAREITEGLKPITEIEKAIVKEITEELKPIKEGIEKLPKTIPLIEPPPPPYELPFADEYEVPGEKKLDEKNLPNYIGKTENGYKLGIKIINFDEVNENVLNKDGGIYSDSPKIYDILTNKKSNVTWDDLNEKERERLGVLIIHSKAIQKNPNNTSKKIGGKKWGDLYSHIWFNRFRYMTQKDVYDDDEIIRDAFNLYKNPHEKTTNETKERIKKILNIEKVDFDRRKYRIPKERPTEKTSSGIVVIPSDPNALLERLDLLLANQNAGHTGVVNELVSICDELKRQKVINADEYKKLNSIIKK